jgi:hypothetical protein
MNSEKIGVARLLIAILWSSFLTSGLATILFFTAFDPAELFALTRFNHLSRLAAYSTGFFIFWLLTAVSSALACYFSSAAAVDGH